MVQTRKSITIRDVAEAAGVSVSTVSRVLNNKDDVALDTFERVKNVIQELGYVSSLAARGMRSRRTNVIGLIMPDVAAPYSITVLQGVNRGIVQFDYDLIVYTSGDVLKYTTTNQETHYVTLLNGTITDGVIVVTPVATDLPANAPLVAIDPNNENPECAAIIANNRDGALTAMNYLIGLGHRRIGFITGRVDLVSGRRRLRGYKDALAAAGIPLDEKLIQTGDYTTETAVECTHALFSLGDPPTAIFASNDMSAMGVYQAAAQVGVRIPDDVSVVGFDNLMESACLDPPLTTVDQFIKDMGRLAVEMILKLVKGEPLGERLHKIQTRLVIRDSCKPLK
jgi:LacI family transcriptional regulator